MNMVMGGDLAVLVGAALKDMTEVRAACVTHWAGCNLGCGAWVHVMRRGANGAHCGCSVQWAQPRSMPCGTHLGRPHSTL